MAISVEANNESYPILNTNCPIFVPDFKGNFDFTEIFSRRSPP